jgi:hypothetical protein
MHRFLLFLATLALLITGASAQVNVNIEVKRRTYIRYEPLLVTVTISNLAGRDLMLEDGESQWFGFTVLHGESQTVISPRDPNYALDPMELKIGETVKRTVNLNQLYPISEYGIHRIRATIYVKSLNQFYTSRTANIDITEGRTMWKQAVGVPDTMPNAGQVNEMSLLSLQGAQHQYLYCRVINPDTGNVLCMQRLGHIIDGTQFDAKFDATNTLHVLQLVGPKTYALSQIGVNGELHGQWMYDAPKSKPYLRRDGTGNLDIVGATRRVEAAKNAPPAPKLSDRPANLPKR